MRRVLWASVWLLAIAGTLILLVASVRHNKMRTCSGLSITIEGESSKLFIGQSEIKRIIAEHVHGNVTGKPIRDFDLKSIEQALLKDIWVKEAKLYFDNNEKFKVMVKERDPVARVFTAQGKSYYIDTSLMMLPLSDLFSARLPVFTGFPSESPVLKGRDSALMRDVCLLGMKILSDSFLYAFIDQVNITADREFEMIPQIGNQVIEFGDAEDAESKFEKLKLFYASVMPRAGWNKYNKITLKYKGQVLAGIAGKGDLIPDAARATEMLASLAQKAEQLAGDSTPQFSAASEKNPADVTMIQQPVSRDEEDNSVSKGKPVAAAKPTVPKISKSERSPAAASNNKTKKRAVLPVKPNSNKKN
jgi:cell division protein FtsQ